MLLVELVPDQLGIDLDPQIAGEGNSEEKPQPCRIFLIYTVETLVDNEYLMWPKYRNLAECHFCLMKASITG